MTGGVRKRGNTWSYYFDLGKIDGKRKKKEKGGFQTKKEAEKALAAAINEYNTVGQVFEPNEITVSDFLDQWFDLYCTINLKYNTQVYYLQTIENHLRPRFGMYKLKALSPAALQEYANELKFREYSRHHIEGILNIMSNALNYAVEPLHYIAANPMSSVKVPRNGKKPRERIILTVDEWNSIRERFAGTRYYIPLMIGFYTGLRISEVFALTWDDIDLEARTLSVNKQVVKRNFGSDIRRVVEKKGKKELRSSWYFQTPKTETSVRTIKFGRSLYDALKEEKTRQLGNEMKYGEFYTVHVMKNEKDEKGEDITRIIPVQKCVESGLPRTRLICITENGQYTSTDTFKVCSRVIHNELHLAFDFHSLRHTHATMLVEAGANIKDVQARLGHADITTTLNAYVHDTEKLSQTTVDIFEKLTAL